MEFLLEGSLQKADYYRFTWKSLSIGRLIFLLIYATLGGWLLATIALDDPSGMELAFIIGGTWLLCSLSIFQDTWSSLRKSISALEPQRIHITEEGIRRDDTYGYFDWKWSNLTRMKETKDMLIVVSDVNVAMIIPNRYFKDMGEKRKVVAFLQSKGVLVK